jgi:hypothetical protein
MRMTASVGTRNGVFAAPGYPEGCPYALQINLVLVLEVNSYHFDCEVSHQG